MITVTRSMPTASFALATMTCSNQHGSSNQGSGHGNSAGSTSAACQLRHINTERRTDEGLDARRALVVGGAEAATHILVIENCDLRSFCLSPCLSVSLPLCLSVSLSLCRSVALSPCLCLCLCLSVSLRLCLDVTLPLPLSPHRRRAHTHTRAHAYTHAYTHKHKHKHKQKHKNTHNTTHTPIHARATTHLPIRSCIPASLRQRPRPQIRTPLPMLPLLAERSTEIEAEGEADSVLPYVQLRQITR